MYKGKGSHSDLGNYRSISVLPHLAKILENFVQRQLMKYLNDHSLINPDQSAFLRFHSTQTSLHCVVDHWLEAILSK